MSDDQTYTASHADYCCPLDGTDLKQMIAEFIDYGVDRIIVTTSDSKTVTIEPALHLSLNDFVKAMTDGA